MTVSVSLELPLTWGHDRLCESGAGCGSDGVTRDVVLLPLDGQCVAQTHQAQLG